jgi:hypothetical protein
MINLYLCYTEFYYIMRFNYDTFYNYYTNPVNVTQDVSQAIQYFHGSSIPRQEFTGTTSIMVGGQKYYIKIKPMSGDMLKNSIMFTLPTILPSHNSIQLPNIPWDIHYHFGMKRIKSRNQKHRGKYLDVVYFHKTVQEPLHTVNKISKNCYFLPNANIDQIKHFDCLETEMHDMTHHFKVGSRDLRVIEELIRRPFYGIHYGGHSRRRTKKRRGRTLHGTRRRTV